ncbi:MAG: beta-ketoacyl-ACP synthase II [Polyangiaceae bacterium]|nr:beta-ketoacyl-ACP synthase II [Polyangiaceae bacterium]
MRRVVITGLGALTPCGNDTERTWAAVCAGKSGLGPLTRFDASALPVRIAGEVKDFDPTRWIERKRLKEGHDFIHYAVAAARMAVESSGYRPANDEARERTGVYIGVGVGPLQFLEEAARTLREKGPSRVSPYVIPSLLLNLAAGQVSMSLGFKGPTMAIASACASGAHSVGEAFRIIRFGIADACVAGGSEAAISPLSVAAFAQMRALSTRNDDPERASRPFDRGRDGFVMAEGAAALMLEERAAAMARGAEIYAEIVGYGATADAYHISHPPDDAEGAQRAMRAALAEAKLDPSAVGYVNAHSTSTGLGDRSELVALRRVFGAHATGGLLVSAPKSMTGHLLGAAGALETLLTALTLKHGIVPPTANLDDPIEEAAGFDLVPHEARRAPIEVALNNSFGFGGANAALVLRRA